MAFVVDASVTMAWCFEDEASEASEAVLDRLRDDEALVPALWALEVANVLLVAERRGRVTEAQAVRFAGLLARLPIRTDAATPGVGELAAPGRLHGLSAYDASYLLLAERAALPLATVDADLAAAAGAAGVELLVPSP